MPKGPSPVPWKPAKSNSEKVVCEESDSESESDSISEEDDYVPKKLEEEPPCCCDQGDDDICDSDNNSDDKKNGNDGEEGCQMDAICTAESQRVPQNKVFPLDDDIGKGCPCTPRSSKRSSKGSK